jgi:DNA-directed RNA polymerase specialized sigma24 family protein
MNTKPQQSGDGKPAPKPQRFSVRAMPAPGHTHRRRIGRAWGKEPTIVYVVDEPKPARIELDRDRQKIVTFSDEISARELETLQGDPHLAVVPVGDGASESLEVNKLKAELMKMADELAKARAEQQDAVELAKLHGEAAGKQAEESSKRIAMLETELSQARAALSKKSTPKPSAE